MDRLLLLDCGISSRRNPVNDNDQRRCSPQLHVVAYCQCTGEVQLFIRTNIQVSVLLNHSAAST